MSKFTKALLLLAIVTTGNQVTANPAEIKPVDDATIKEQLNAVKFAGSLFSRLHDVLELEKEYSDDKSHAAFVEQFQTKVALIQKIVRDQTDAFKRCFGYSENSTDKILQTSDLKACQRALDLYRKEEDHAKQLVTLRKNPIFANMFAALDEEMEAMTEQEKASRNAYEKLSDVLTQQINFLKQQK